MNPVWLAATRAASGGVVYDPAAAALFAAMSVQPDSARKTLINNTIVALKAAGIWAALDELWVMAAHTQQAALLGWKRNKDLSLVVGMPFTTDRGIGPGDGASQYADTGFVPSADGVNWTLNDASLGIYSRTDTNANVVDIGAAATFNIGRSLVQMRLSNLQFCGVNSNSVINTAAANSLGMGASRRASSSTAQIYRNGSQVSSASLASTSLTAFSLYIGALNLNGAAANHTQRQYSYAHVGGSLTSGQHSTLYSTIQSYMTAVGAAV